MYTILFILLYFRLKHEHTQKVKHAYDILIITLVDKTPFEKDSVDGRKILKQIFKK
jgi:hypothetical protein